MKNWTLSKWLKVLEADHSSVIKLGLDNCKIVKSNLRLNKIAETIVTVAGTNGKGSSIALMESILLKLGYTVGTYTSPHLRHYSERIKINSEAVQEEIITDAFRRVENARDGVGLTYFEFSTLAAFVIFKNASLDFVLLEVGLGGRLDAVNSVDPDVCLITSIGIDHQEFLGSSREEIGLEKAGIMRENVFCICSDAAIPKSVLDHARRTGAELRSLGVDFFIEQNEFGWDWWDDRRSIEGLSKNGLFGEHQLRNAAGAIELISMIEGSIDGDLVRCAIENVRLEGRFQELFEDGRKIILDVAHNPQAAEALAHNLSIRASDVKTFAIVALMKTKDINGFLSQLVSEVDVWIFPLMAGDVAHSNVSLKEEIVKIRKNAVGVCCGSVKEAVQTALKSSGVGDVILISGSFITVGEAIEILGLSTS